MSNAVDLDSWRTKRVKDWLLAILRFAVTMEQADESTVLAIADEMDRSGFHVNNTAFTFFGRTGPSRCCDRFG